MTGLNGRVFRLKVRHYSDKWRIMFVGVGFIRNIFRKKIIGVSVILMSYIIGQCSINKSPE